MTEPVTPRDEKALPSLTSLRWYAALLVFLYHLNEAGFYWRPSNLFRFGYTGVGFFFVLSGFVLAWSSGPRIDKGMFWFRRFARIYPLHLATFLLVGLVLVAFPSVPGDLGPGAAVLHLTLTQAWWPDFATVSAWNGPSWSLSCEAFFYLCFPFVLGRMRRTTTRRGTVVVLLLLVLAALATVLAHRYGGSLGAGPSYVDPAVRLPEFALGVLLAVAMRRGDLTTRLPVWSGILLTAVLGLLSWRGLAGFYPLSDYLLLPGFVLLVVTAAAADRRDSTGRLERVLRHRFSLYLGELSFAFYLVHVRLAIFPLDTAFGWLHPWSTTAGLGPAVTLFAASAAGAVVLHHLVEKPTRRLLLGFAARRRTSTRAVPPLG